MAEATATARRVGLIERLASVRRSTGCTEPGAVALAASLAAAAAGGRVERVSVACDRHTLRNALQAVLPGTGGQRGVRLAAALGALLARTDRVLELLEAANPTAVWDAQQLVARGSVHVDLHEPGGEPRLWIDARVRTSEGEGRAVIADHHAHVVLVEHDGEERPLPAWSRPAGAAGRETDWRDWPLSRVLALASDVDDEDESFLLDGLELNLAAAERGQTGGPGQALARAVGAGALAWDLPTRAEALASSASHARMTGQAVAVMTSGWSGNQGCVATIPVGLVAEERGATRRERARALATSHLVGSWLRAYTGVLSPLCNSMHAAAAGAAAGCVRLLGGGYPETVAAIHQVIAALGGALCDGARPACAIKVGTAAHHAVRAAALAMSGFRVEPSSGLIGADVEQTARNLGRLVHPAMAGVDEEVLRLLLAAEDSCGAAPPA